MKKTHRNVEFDVHRLDDTDRWEWIAYPKIGEGDRFAGVVEGDEEKATAAATAAIDARLGSVSEPRESARPFQPDPSQWGTSTWDDAAARIATSHSQRNDALLNSGGSQVFPPPPQTTIQVPPTNSAATVDTPPGAIAGTAPHEMKLETGKYALEGGSTNAGADTAPSEIKSGAPGALRTTSKEAVQLEARGQAQASGQGGLTANADVASAQRRVIAQFRENPERAEMLGRAWATKIRQEIERLEGQRRNEPEWRDQIDFLRAIADALDNIVTAISEARRAATPKERDQKFSEAERWATSLAKAAKGFAERNYERVTDYGGYSAFVILGTVLFTNMFGVPAEIAIGTQLALLGLSGKKKD
jgi:hypothetical protein